MSPKVLIICGPTASGKTALALRLARAEPTSIVAADSRQVYRGLDLLSGKDIPAHFTKTRGFYTDGATRLFGFDLINPDQTMSAAVYADYARSVIAHETKAGRRVIVVGGTGFYLSALAHPERLARVAPNPKLRQDLSRLTLSSLKRRLQKTAPARFAAMNHSDQNNPRRLIRAIEVANSRPLASRHKSLINFLWWGIKTSPLLKKRLEVRVRQRLKADALAELEALLTRHPDSRLPIYQSLGVKWLLEFREGRVDRATLISRWVTDEYHYAKRQLTWFKKQSEIIWYDQDRLSRLKLPS